MADIRYNPETGLVQTAETPEQLQDLELEGYTLAPSIDQMRQAQLLDTEGNIISGSGIITPIALKNIPTKTVDDKKVLDIEQTVNIYGADKARELLEQSVSEQDRPRIPQAIDQVLNLDKYTATINLPPGVKPGTRLVLPEQYGDIELTEGTPELTPAQALQVSDKAKLLQPYNILDSTGKVIKSVSAIDISTGKEPSKQEYEEQQGITETKLVQPLTLIAQAPEFAPEHRLPNGEIVSESDWNRLSAEDKHNLEVMGIEQFNTLLNIRNERIKQEGRVALSLASNISDALSMMLYEQAQQSNTTGLTLFQYLIAQGKIPTGSVYAGIGDTPDSVRYYEPGVMTVLNNGEILPTEVYESLSSEIKSIVDNEGIAGLQLRVKSGTVPLPNILGNEWVNVRTGEIATTDELDSRFDRNSSQWDEWIRNKPSFDILSDLEKSVSTIITNTQTKIANWTEEQTGLEGNLPPQSPEEMVGFVARALSSAALTAAAMIPMVVITAGKTIVKPSIAPSIAKNMLSGIKTSFSTVGKALVTGDVVSPEQLGMSTLVVALMLDAATNTVMKLTTWIAPKGVPPSVIGREAATARVNVGEIDPVALGKAVNEAEVSAMKPGNVSGTISVGATNFELRYVKTPIQSNTGNILWHGTTQGLDFVKESGDTLVAGKSGLYTDPWAALAYTKGSNTPAVLMIITDSSKVKPPPASVLAQLPSNSDAFIRGARAGFYGSSKTWMGDFESEIVAAPNTQFIIPEPTADLLTRVLVGKYSDFFTYNGERFVPIKIAIDRGLIDSGIIPRIPTVTDLYAAKLQAVNIALQDTAFSILHPSTLLSDIIRLRSNPGIRDIYLMQNGNVIKGIAQSLASRTSELRASGYSESAVSSIISSEYSSVVSSLISKYPEIASAYSINSDAKAKFEALYDAALSDSLESLVKTAEVSNLAVAESLGIEPIELQQATELISDQSIEPIGDSIFSVPSSNTLVQSLNTIASEVKTEEVPPSQVSIPISETKESELEPTLSEVLEPESGIEEPVSEIEEVKEIPPDEEFIFESIESPPPISSTISSIDKATSSVFNGSRHKIPISTVATGIRSDISTFERNKGFNKVYKKRITSKPIKYKRIEPQESAIAWRQGSINGQAVWYVVKSPYKSMKDVTRYIGTLPKGVRDVMPGKGSALRSIQVLTGLPPKKLAIDLGIFDLSIFSGKTILYSRDIRQKTTGDITIKSGVRRTNNRKRDKGINPTVTRI